MADVDDRHVCVFGENVATFVGTTVTAVKNKLLAVAKELIILLVQLRPLWQFFLFELLFVSKRKRIFVDDVDFYMATCVIHAFKVNMLQKLLALLLMLYK